jgi:hypothetical protein
MVFYESLSGDILVGRIYVMYLGHFNHHIGMCTASQAHSIIGTVGYPGTPKCTSLQYLCILDMARLFPACTCTAARSVILGREKLPLSPNGLLSHKIQECLAPQITVDARILYR